MNFTLFICVVLIMCTNMNVTYSENITSVGIRDKVLSCSDYLNRLLNSLCDVNITIKYKRDTSTFIGKLMPIVYSHNKKKHRIINNKRKHRVRRQIADKCCETSCTIRYIIGYCAKYTKLVREHPEVFYFPEDR